MLFVGADDQPLSVVASASATKIVCPLESIVATQPPTSTGRAELVDNDFPVVFHSKPSDEIAILHLMRLKPASVFIFCFVAFLLLRSAFPPTLECLQIFQQFLFVLVR
jgi:hypothetical protein